MAFLKIKHGDITKMSMDEMRELKSKWDKMNKAAITICTYYLVPFFFVVISTTVSLIIQLVGLSLDYNMFKNILPFFIFIPLIFSIVQMKYDNIKGHLLTFLLYLFLLLILVYKIGFHFWLYVTAPILLVPIFLTFRCMLNYNIIIKLRKMPGYPTFFYTVSSKLAHEIYLKNENQDGKQDIKKDDMKSERISKDYIPWNAFDEEVDKNKEKGANAGDENCIKEEGNDF